MGLGVGGEDELHDEILLPAGVGAGDVEFGLVGEGRELDSDLDQGSFGHFLDVDGLLD